MMFLTRWFNTSLGSAEDYSDGRYAIRFKDSNDVVWIVQITGFRESVEVASGAVNFYTEIDGPNRTIILKDGELVDSLDGMAEGSVSVNNGAIFQVKQ